MSDLAAALMVAIRTHAGQLDKQGQPYLLHVLRVVEAVQPTARVVAALHDVVEDGGEEGRRQVARLGLDEVDAVALALLTRDLSCCERGTYEGYIAAINSRPLNDIAREVKLADLRDNLGRIPPKPEPGTDLGIELDGRERWVRDWSGLKRRYERAIETLGGTT